MRLLYCMHKVFQLRLFLLECVCLTEYFLNYTLQNAICVPISSTVINTQIQAAQNVEKTSHLAISFCYICPSTCNLFRKAQTNQEEATKNEFDIRKAEVATNKSESVIILWILCVIN